MHLYFFPLSTYSQKTLIALYEKSVSFSPQVVALNDAEARAAYKKLYPLGKVPLLVDADRTIPESSIIIEYIDQRVPTGPRLVPLDADAGRRVRFHDRMFDLHLNEPARTLIFDRIRPEKRDAEATAKAKETIDVVYTYLDEHLAKNTWAYGDTFTMADCAAAPPLFYLRTLHPFEKHARVNAYWNRLVERPSIARVFAEAKPGLAAIGM
jgi:glutathione S-transferase